IEQSAGLTKRGWPSKVSTAMPMGLALKTSRNNAVSCVTGLHQSRGIALSPIKLKVGACWGIASVNSGPPDSQNFGTPKTPSIPRGAVEERTIRGVRKRDQVREFYGKAGSETGSSTLEFQSGVCDTSFFVDDTNHHTHPFASCPPRRKHNYVTT